MTEPSRRIDFKKTKSASFTSGDRCADGSRRKLVAFVGFDSSEQLVLWTHVDHVYPSAIVRLFTEGITLTQLLEGMASKGAHTRSGSSPAVWVERQLAVYRSEEKNAGVDNWLSDGRWVRVSCGRTEEGGIASFHSDVTQIKEELKQKRLARRPQREGVALDSQIKERFEIEALPDSPFDITQYSGGVSKEKPPSLLMQLVADEMVKGNCSSITTPLLRSAAIVKRVIQENPKHLLDRRIQALRGTRGRVNSLNDVIPEESPAESCLSTNSLSPQVRSGRSFNLKFSPSSGESGLSSPVSVRPHQAGRRRTLIESRRNLSDSLLVPRIKGLCCTDDGDDEQPGEGSAAAAESARDHA